MENHYLDSLLSELKELFEEQNFTEVDTGVYENGKKAVKISYDEATKMYLLFMADINEGERDEFVEVSSWLFDETQNESDAISVGMDFCETIREKLGAKIVRSNMAQVDLPTYNKDAEYNVTAFAKKMLDVFPQFKEPYLEHVKKYGNFLYLDFFGTYLVPELTKVFKENNKKSVKKVIEVMETGYVNGDREAVNVLVAVLAAAVCRDDAAKENLITAFGENKHLIQSVTSFIPNILKNAKLSKSLLK